MTDWIETWLSRPRFATYLAAAAGDRDLALALYEWNAAVSAAFHRDIGLTDLHPDLQQAITEDRIRFKVSRECTRLHTDLQPLLASGELPEDVVKTWLVDLRIKAEEQVRLWRAGPPYMPSVKPNEEEPPAGSPDEYPVFTPHAGESTASAEPNQSEQGEGPVIPADTTQPTTATASSRRTTPQLVIKVEERSPQRLAQALREHLAPAEINDLITELSN